MPEKIAVSSWALHRTIGASYPDAPSVPRPIEMEAVVHGPDVLPLLEVPGELAKRGYSAMQLCHFHIPSIDRPYLSEFKASLDEAGVSLHGLLVDDGDITHPEHGDRDAAWIAKWLEIGEQIGAKNARVIAGKQPNSPENLSLAKQRIRHLASGTRVRLHTENWFDLLATPEAVLEVIDDLDGLLGLCADFGNWPRPRKYEDLPKIMPRAEACHAKFEFVTETELDEPDAAVCLGYARDASFTGTYVLVNGGIGKSDWDALAIQRDRILAG